MHYQNIFLRPVWSSKAFRETYKLQLPKSNMNSYDVGIHLMSLSPYQIFNTYLVETINHIRNNMLGTTFNKDTLETYLQDIYAKADGDVNPHELAILSHIFTEITEGVYIDATSIGCKMCSNKLIELSINYLAEVKNE